MIRVVIDTNVVVSANLVNEGPSATIVSLAINKRILMFVSTAVLAEYQTVLSRPRRRRCQRRVHHHWQHQTLPSSVREHQNRHASAVLRDHRAAACTGRERLARPLSDHPFHVESAGEDSGPTDARRLGVASPISCAAFLRMKVNSCGDRLANTCGRSRVLLLGFPKHSNKT
jgi:uncharacterized protein with PIN domain